MMVSDFICEEIGWISSKDDTFRVLHDSSKGKYFDNTLFMNHVKKTLKLAVKTFPGKNRLFYSIKTVFFR